ncbi:hypothetical protein DRP77_07605 [Candidatus Poribacteria bacterium]|nr:MAG: hypothetical protein DRP77_07605 [Candidatus Poribacteria bacterium]
MLFRGRKTGGETWRTLGEMSTIGMVLVISTIIGFLIGRYLGIKLGQETVGSVLGTVVGAGAGFVQMFRMAGRYLREEERGSEDEGDQ